MLAYKSRGEKEDFSSWRPICLQNTLYKVYAACISKWVATWAMEVGPRRDSSLMKVAFMLQSCMQDAR